MCTCFQIFNSVSFAKFACTDMKLTDNAVGVRVLRMVTFLGYSLQKSTRHAFSYSTIVE
jgi:hypothetical protein